MTARIRVGNQTAISCGDALEPFEFALRQGFDAFEWFEDRKVDGHGRVLGWDASDLGPSARASIRRIGELRDVLFTVHAPWQANPLHPGGVELLLRSVDLASDLGACLVNLHLYMDRGPEGYVEALAPVVSAARERGLRLSIENTPHTSPDDFNATFACMQQRFPVDLVGMCFDLGHANLCAVTHNDFVRYFDALAPEVPVTHLHVHENRGDADSHLTIFTGPAGDDDRGVRAFCARLIQRGYTGAMILEQWPRPPELLVQAACRLRQMLAAAESSATPTALRGVPA